MKKLNFKNKKCLDNVLKIATNISKSLVFAYNFTNNLTTIINMVTIKFK